MARVLSTRALHYIALISYALYITHHVLLYTWLGSGSGLEKYLKRVPLLLATFALSHLSTFYFEKWFTETGKRLSNMLADVRSGHMARGTHAPVLDTSSAQKPEASADQVGGI